MSDWGSHVHRRFLTNDMPDPRLVQVLCRPHTKWPVHTRVHWTLDSDLVTCSKCKAMMVIAHAKRVT